MTEPAQPPAAPVLPERVAPEQPKLVHSGLYTLWETPEGGRLLVFKRLHTRDPLTGQVVDIHQPADQHLPEVPPDALPLVSMWLENGFPPAILAMIKAGKANPLAMIRQLRDLAGGYVPDEPAAGAEPAGGADAT